MQRSKSKSVGLQTGHQAFLFNPRETLEDKYG